MKIIKNKSGGITDEQLKLPWYIELAEIFNYNIIMFIRIKFVPYRMYYNYRKKALKNKKITFNLIFNELDKVLFDHAIAKYDKKRSYEFWNDFFKRMDRKTEWERANNPDKE